MENCLRLSVRCAKRLGASSGAYILGTLVPVEEPSKASRPGLDQTVWGSSSHLDVSFAEAALQR
jgi:hypothetical protein